MNIMGENTLACTKGFDGGQLDPIKVYRLVYRLPHLSILADLVPDRTSFFARHTLIQRAKVSWSV